MRAGQPYKGKKEPTSGRGSIEAIDGRCGARLRRSNPPRYCKRYPVRGRKRCRLHGGTAPRGIASPHYKHGRYSRLLNSEILLAGYAAIEDDHDFISTREEIRLWTARQFLLLSELKSLDVAATRPGAPRRDDKAQDLADPQSELHEAALESTTESTSDIASREARIWRELGKCTDLLIRLRRAERKAAEFASCNVSTDAVLKFVSDLTDLALEAITDDSAREWFFATLQLWAKERRSNHTPSRDGRQKQTEKGATPPNRHYRQ